jgi:hypothetical protein
MGRPACRGDVAQHGSSLRVARWQALLWGVIHPRIMQPSLNPAKRRHLFQKGRKQFFFEKKNQKTFGCFASGRLARACFMVNI